jgi:uncharacterized protein YrrD
MSSQQVAIGADVQTSDGRSIGKVEHLIIDGESKQLAAIVADKGIFDSGRVVDLEYVKSMSEKVVVLSISEDEAKALPGFAEHEFIRLGDSAEVGIGGSGATVDIGPTGSAWMSYGASAGGLPSTGASSFFPMPVVGDVQAQVVGPLTDSEIALGNGTDVVDAAMNKIGVIDDIIFDENGKIESFIVQQGHVFHHDVRVPIEWVAGITHEHVRLNVLKDEVAKSKA